MSTAATMLDDINRLWQQYSDTSGRRLTYGRPGAIIRTVLPNEREGIMARTTTSTTARRARKPAAKTPVKATKTPAKRAAAAKPTTAKPKASTRQAPKHRDDAAKIKIAATIEKRLKAGETMNAIAESLHIYPFQAHQYVALKHVSDGTVPKIPWKTSEQLTTKVAAERDKGGSYASWDYLQARTGVNKTKLKNLLQSAGHSITDVRKTRAAKGEDTPRSVRRNGATRKAAPAEPKKAARRTRTTKATPAPVSKRRAAANGRKVRELAKRPEAQPVKMRAVAKSKPKTTVVARTRAVKPAATKAKATVVKRTRKPAPDPS